MRTAKGRFRAFVLHDLQDGGRKTGSFVHVQSISMLYELGHNFRSSFKAISGGQQETKWQDEGAWKRPVRIISARKATPTERRCYEQEVIQDRKSTRLNSSHQI